LSTGRGWLGLLLACNFPQKFLSLSRQGRDEICRTGKGELGAVDVLSPIQNLPAPWPGRPGQRWGRGGVLWWRKIKCRLVWYLGTGLGAARERRGG